MNDKISIVIPVYNGAQYLEQTLGSILAQTYEYWEAILVDDSSSDESYEIIQKFAQKDQRFKVYRKPNQKFACYGIELGVENASGKWFCYMSQDDRLSRDFLEVNLNAAAVTGADIVLGQMVFFRDDFEEVFSMPVSPGDVISGREAFELSLNWRIHGFFIMKVEMMKKVGITTGLLNSDEYDTRRYYFFADKVTFTSAKFYYHVGNPSSVTKKWDISQLDYVKVAHKLRAFCQEEGVEHMGEIDDLLRWVSGSACIRAAEMVCLAHRAGNATRLDLKQVMKTIVEYQDEWLGRTKALKIGVAVYPIIGSRMALKIILTLLNLNTRLIKFNTKVKKWLK